MWRYFGLVSIGAVTTFAIDWVTNHSVLSIPVSIGLITAGWCVYLEKSVGGIMLRPDPNGNFVFRPRFIKDQVEWPLFDRRAWRPENWDLNYYTVIGGTVGTYYLINY